MAKPALRVLRTGGLYFNGVNDYVKVPYNSMFDLQEYTISVEFNPLRYVNLNGRGDVILCRHDRAGYAHQYEISLTSPTQGCFFYTIAGANKTIDFTYNLGEYIHIAATAKTGEQALYKNGVLVGRNAYEGTFSYTTRGTFLGKAYHGDPANVIIKRVCIYNRVLSRSEISEIYTKGTFIKDGLVMCLPFHEGEGNIAHDVSGYGNHGTIYGASWVVKKALRVLPKAR